MHTKLFTTAVLLMLTVACFSQQTTAWDKWNWLIGTWQGEGSGAPGQGNGTFSFAPILDQKVMERKSHTEFPAMNGKPAFAHTDLMYVYTDASGNPTKAIYFDNEGHTIQYNVACNDTSIVFTSEKAANMPIFRLTYTCTAPNKVSTTFEMSRDGNSFMTYIAGNSVKTE